MSTQHYLVTRENFGDLASWMDVAAPDLRALGFRDIGMAQIGSIINATDPPGPDNPRPPAPAAFNALADVCHARSMPFAIEAEERLRAAWADNWIQDNAACRATQDVLAQALALVRARRPTVPIWVEHQMMSAANLSTVLADEAATDASVAAGNGVPPLSWRAFAQREASLLAPLVSGVTVMAYLLDPHDYPAWLAQVDWHRAQFAVHYPGKRAMLWASPQYQAGPLANQFVGVQNMDRYVDWATQNDADVTWWYASFGAPPPEAFFSYLRALPPSEAPPPPEDQSPRTWTSTLRPPLRVLQVNRGFRAPNQAVIGALVVDAGGHRFEVERDDSGQLPRRGTEWVGVRSDRVKRRVN